jgi:4-amino-4-deoxy-L-arabinose transferase-like glycosyltransferase
MLFPQKKFRLDKRTVFFFSTLFLLSACGVWLLVYSTPFGLGLNDDSVAYIAGARSILSGNGYREAWLASNGPVTHFPPGYPVVLAVIGFLTGLDPLRGARAVGGLLFGLNIALTGWLGYRMTQRQLTGILAAALTLLSSSLLQIHARAMSEPLYLSLMLLGFILLDIYFQHPRARILILLGVVLGWAYLARYAAIALLVTMVAVLLILHRDWRVRIKSASILLASSIPWILLWSIRNRIVGGSFTNRVLGWHPITLENWGLGVSTFAEFFVPITRWRRNLAGIPGILEGFLLLVGILLLIWVLSEGIPHFLRPSRKGMPPVLPFANALYVIVYMSVLVATMTLFDPATKFQVRILSPIYISIILLILALGIWLWKGSGLLAKPVIFLAVVGFAAMFAFGQSREVQNLRRGGGVFANERWADSEAIVALKKLPEQVLILSNEPGLVYLYAGRPSGVLPKTEAGIANIRPFVLDGEIVLALFNVNTVDSYTLEYYYRLGEGLYLTDYSNAWIFSAFPK